MFPGTSSERAHRRTVFYYLIIIAAVFTGFMVYWRSYHDRGL